MMNRRRSEKRMGALSWVLILAFLLTSLGQVNGVVLAQEEVPTETPMVTSEAPTPEATETPEIIAEPTEGDVSAQSELPNLTIVTPDAWEAPLIFSSRIQTHTYNTMVVGKEVFLDFAVYNNGADINSVFDISVFFDGTSLMTFSVDHLAAGSFYKVEDWNYLPDFNPTPGVHTIELYADSAWLNGVGFISESDETDNTWSKELTWYSPDDPEKPSDGPANDLITNAVELFLDTPFQQDTFGSTISSEAAGAELADPVNVCNADDEESVWFKFEAPTTGIYLIDTKDSQYLPNITVVKHVSSTQRDSIVCGNTDSWDVTRKLAFMATENETYLIGFSTHDNIFGRELKISLSQMECETNHLCGVAIDGDGSVIHNPSVRVNDGGTWIFAYQEERNFSSYFSVDLSEYASDQYTLVVHGGKSLIIDENVPMPGIFNASAVGYQKVLLDTKDSKGEYFTPGQFVIYRTQDDLGNAIYLDSSKITNPQEFYLAPGEYDFEAISDTGLLQVYRPGVSVVDSVTTQTVSLNAQELSADSFKFLLDGLDGAKISFATENYSYGVALDENDTVTFAAPSGEKISYINAQMLVNDEDSNEWDYISPLGWNVPIVGGQEHVYTLGGPLAFHVSVEDDIAYIEDGGGQINTNLVDGHGNRLSYVYGYAEGQTSKSYLPINLDFYDPNNSQVTSKSFTNFYYSNQFSIPTDKDLGTWTVEASIDLGPLGGGLQTASSTFTVDSLANHPVLNDDFDSATVIESMPFSLKGYNTRGSTSATDDPTLENMPSDWWGNSVWFTYTATQSGILTLDTIGTNYGTLLTVWQGSRGALSNIAVNDNYYDPVTTIPQTYSQVSFPVSAGQTYYIMVQGFVGFGMQGYGKLNLHGSLAANPNCYSLSVSANSTTYGSVQVLTAPNCGTQYSEGTKVLLSAVAKPGYGFYNWSNSSTDDPYTLTINANTVLKANFVKMVAPAVTVPTAGALINDASPSFAWSETQYADTYQIQIDSQSSFTLPIDQDETVTTLTYESPALSADGVKYYRVRAINAYGDAGPWSAVRSFTLDTLSPAAPSLTAPADSAWIVGVPTYTWTAVVGANVYRFEYDTEADFANAVASGLLSSTSYKPLEQTPGTYYWRVWARDAAGNWSLSASNVNTVTVLAAIPPAPKITPFSNGPLTNSSTPSIEWGAVYFANTYTLQISNTTTFAALLVDQSMDAATLKSVFNAPNDGDFYARVRAFNSSGEASPWSAVYKFTVDTVAPAVPTLLSPIGGSYPGTTLAKLTLAPVSTAKSYEYQVNDSNTFETPILSVSSASTGYATTASQALPLGLLYWRARAVDAAGNPSNWSAPQSFYQTNQKTPNTTAVVTVATPTFTWSALTGATGYRLLVCQDEGMTDCVIDETLAQVTKYVSPDAFTPAVYYWQIKGIGGVYDGQVTLPIQFSVSPVIPAAPKPYFPANGAFVSDKTPGLSWTSVLTAVSYEVQINRASTFAGDGLEQTTAESWVEADSLADGKYYWRVRAIDANGAFSKWSSIYSFSVDTIKPDAPSLVSPGTDDVVNSQLPKLTVTKVMDATTYEYQASDSPDFIPDSSLVVLDKTINTNFYSLVSGQQLPLGKIYWRARVIDAANNPSAWSDVDSFWVTIQKLPANGSFITSTQPQFTWIATPNAINYSLKVCKNIDLTDCVVNVDLLSVTSYKPSVPLELGKYYWQLGVQTIESDGMMTSPILSFTVTSASLAAPVLLTPAVNLQTNDTTVELTWQSVPEATNYEVQISQTASFTTLVESALQSGTKYTSESLADGRYYWRVRTLNTYDAPGSWSVVRNFMVDTQPTIAPTTALPANESLVNTFTPKLSVKTVSGAKSYQFQLFPTGSPEDVWAVATVNTPTYTLTAAQALKFGSFSWRARTLDAAGNESDWSEPVRFIMTLQKNPLNGSYTKVANTTFTWAAFPGATGFRVKICEDQAMETGCISSADLTAAMLKFVLPSPLPDGIYYWQIEVLGSALENPFTPVLSFIKVH